MKAHGEQRTGMLHEQEENRRIIALWRWGLLLLLILLWEIGARLGWIDPFFFSSPAEIARTAALQAQKGTLWRDILYTGAATLAGFAAGTVLGSVLGLVCWFSRRATMVAEPWLIVLNALPKLALAPVMVIF